MVPAVHRSGGKTRRRGCTSGCPAHPQRARINQPQHGKPAPHMLKSPYHTARIPRGEGLRSAPSSKRASTGQTPLYPRAAATASSKIPMASAKWASGMVIGAKNRITLP